MVVWNSTYAIGVEIIDLQHIKFINAIEKLSEPFDAFNREEKLKEVFTELDNYSRFHFETEEAYFKAFNYEEAVEHEAKHDEFKEIVGSYKDRLGEEGVPDELANFLENWLADHVLTMDKKYVKCFHDHGLK